jgi:tRNA pseudouridine38-40 synthase
VGPVGEHLEQRLKLWAVIEYDGTDFYGFQLQAHERTVQGEIERALEAITGERRRIGGAGRTDRGVHACGQVIGFEVTWRHSLEELHRALEATLASDVAVLKMGEATDDFHPRYSARSRVYRYTIWNQTWRSPLHRRTAWHVRQKLDLDRIARATQCLPGTHDFGAFGRPPQHDGDGDAVRTVLRADWQKQDSVLTFDIEANAFLYRMVRSIVGTLVRVGRGDLSPDEFQSILEGRSRSEIKLVAPPQGLCLMQVNYAACEGVLQ